ncbi:MAG TPA: hypothetical protein VGD81_16440 [Opitutaceae bacterium]
MSRFKTRLMLVTLACGLGGARTIAEPVPQPSAKPYGEELELVFADEFDGDRLDPAVWTSQAYEKGLSRGTARGPDNAEVRDGELRLHVRKEARVAGRRTSEWTAGYVYSRDTVEPNVFLEARFKPGQATGVNNAFWLACVESRAGAGVSDRYEIDVVETRQEAGAPTPTGRGHLAWHDWKTFAYARNAKGERDHVAQGMHVEHSFDEYHTWGLWLGESETIYYLDGREVWRGDTHSRYADQWRTGVGKFRQWFPDEEKRAYGRFGQDDWSYQGGYTGDRMNIVFSNLPWADPWTPLTDAADGTYMAVDYVRAYRPKRLLTAEPEQHALATGHVVLPAAADKVVPFSPELSLPASGRHPRYFSFVARAGAGARLRVAFTDAQGRDVLFVGGGAGDGLRAGFTGEVSSATAYPASEHSGPWIEADREMCWIVRVTPPATEGAKAAVSLCVFPADAVPVREPFFHGNIDAHGNTSVNNGWHLNAKEPAEAAVLRALRFQNHGTGTIELRDVRVGPSFRSVRPVGAAKG